MGPVPQPAPSPRIDPLLSPSPLANGIRSYDVLYWKKPGEKHFTECYFLAGMEKSPNTIIITRHSHGNLLCFYNSVTPQEDQYPQGHTLGLEMLHPQSDEYMTRIRGKNTFQGLKIIHNLKLLNAERKRINSPGGGGAQTEELA
jgi:hypothetical protein